MLLTGSAATLLLATTCYALSNVETPVSMLSVSTPLTMMVDDQSRTLGSQGRFYGSKQTLPYWIFESQSNPESDPVVIWIANGNSVSDLEAMALGMGPVTAQSTKHLRDNPYALNRNVNVVFLAHPGEKDVPNMSIDQVLSAADEVALFVELFSDKYGKYSLGQGVQLGGESFTARHIPVFAATIMARHDRPVNVSSVILGDAFINPESQYNSYWTANCEDTSNDSKMCSRLAYMVEKLLPKLKNCQVNPALPFCQNLVPKLQSASLKELISQNSDVYGISKDSTGSSKLDYIARTMAADERSPPGIFEFYKDPTLLLQQNSTELVQPYQYLVSALLEDGIRVLVYTGENDMVYNWQGADSWTSTLTWKSSSPPLLQEGELILDGVASGQAKVRGGLTFVKIPNAGHLPSLDNPRVQSNLVGRWLDNQPLELFSDLENTPLAVSIQRKSAQIGGQVLDVSVGVKATLEPLIITVTNTVTKASAVETPTVFETVVQTRTRKNRRISQTDGSPLETAHLPASDAITNVPIRPIGVPETVSDPRVTTVLLPTTTTELSILTLPASTITVTETITMNQMFSIQTWPVETTSYQMPLDPTDSATSLVSTVQSQDVVWEFTSQPSATSTGAPLFENGPVDVAPTMVNVGENTQPTADLHNAFTVTVVPATSTLLVTFPGVFKVRPSANPDPNNGLGDHSAHSTACTSSELAQDQIFSSQPTVAMEIAEGVPVEEFVEGGGVPPGYQDERHVQDNVFAHPGHVIEAVPPNPGLAIETAPPALPHNPHQYFPPAAHHPVFSAAHPSVPQPQETSGHIPLPLDQDNVFNPALHDDDDPDDYDYNDDSADNQDTDEDDDYGNDDDDHDWDDDSDDDDDDDDYDPENPWLKQFHHRIDRKVDRFSNHVDHAVNHVENGLDLTTDSLENGMDAMVDGVEDTMDHVENGLDRAMNSFKRLGRVFS